MSYVSRLICVMLSHLTAVETQITLGRGIISVPWKELKEAKSSWYFLWKRLKKQPFDSLTTCPGEPHLQSCWWLTSSCCSFVSSCSYAAPDEVRLVGGASQCGGILEIYRLSEWKPVDDRGWNLRLAGAVCGQLDCGSAVSIRRRQTPSSRFIWELKSYCEESSPMKCLRLISSSAVLEVTCSGNNMNIY